MNNYRKILSFSAFSLAICLSQPSPSANAAAVTTYSNETNFVRAVGPITVAESFNGGHLNGTLITSIGGSYALAYGALHAVAGYYGPFRGGQYTTLYFSKPIKSFAFNFGDFGFDPLLNAPETARIWLYDGRVHQAVMTPWEFPYGFFGLSSDTPFNYVSITDATYNTEPEVDTVFWIDSFLIPRAEAGPPVPPGGPSGSPVPPPSGSQSVPLPASVLLLGGGLTVMLLGLTNGSRTRRLGAS